MRDELQLNEQRVRAPLNMLQFIADLKVARERVRQIQTNALRTLRHPLGMQMLKGPYDADVGEQAGAWAGPPDQAYPAKRKPPRRRMEYHQEIRFIYNNLWKQ